MFGSKGQPERCRGQTADISAAARGTWQNAHGSGVKGRRNEGMVQTTNPKGAAKVVVGTHNPLVAGSNPAGPIRISFFASSCPSFFVLRPVAEPSFEKPPWIVSSAIC